MFSLGKTMGVHFLTFYDGFLLKYKIAAKQLMQWVYDYSLFDTITSLTFRYLEDEPDFKKHVPFVKTNTRGFGYWIWKPFAIRKALRNLRDGDVLVYMDACTKLNIEGKPRFLEYLQWVEQSKHGMVVIGSPHKVKTWCKMDLILEMNAEHLFDNEMLMAGIVFLKKNEVIMNFVDCWCSLVEKYHLIDDSPSIASNHPEFIEHRHDQSIFTLLYYSHPVSDGSRQIPDAEYYFPDKRPEDLIHPIWIQSNYY